MQMRSGRDITPNPESGGLPTLLFGAYKFLNLALPYAPKARLLELHHYTSTGGVLGILGARSLRFTDARFLNDTTEVTHAIRLFHDAVVEKRRTVTSAAAATFLELVKDALDAYVAKSPPHYVACFSGAAVDGEREVVEQPPPGVGHDRLSQWRGYGGATGVPYAITFDFSELHSELFGVYLGEGVASSGSVLYGKEEQAAWVRAHLDAFTPEALSGPPGFNDEDFGDLVDYFMTTAVHSVAARMKHAGFSEEQEFRIVLRGVPLGSEIEFDEHRESGVVVPFVTRYLDTLSNAWLSRITQGPALHPDAAEIGMRTWLASKKYSPDLLRTTEIPLRLGL